MTEVRGQRSEDRGQMTDDRVLNWEAGMRPPAHRGLCLRPGGKAEKKERRHGGEDRGN